MTGRRIDAGPLLALLGGLVLLVSLFLDFYEPTFTAWEVFELLDLVLAALAVAVVRRRRDLVPGPLRALLLGFPLAMVLTAVAVLVLDRVGLVPAEFLQGRRPLTSFVASPDEFSVIVAVLAGIAGTLSLTSAKAGPLVGVFISVTTVPAAADFAAGVVTAQYATAFGALWQLVLNLVCILVAAVLTLRVQHGLWRRAGRRAGR